MMLLVPKSPNVTQSMWAHAAAAKGLSTVGTTTK